MSAIEDLRSDAAALLRDGTVKLVIGYRTHDGRTKPAMLRDASAAAGLVHDAGCAQNPAAFLMKPEVRASFPVAVVASPPVMRSLVLLASESQLAGTDVVVLAVDAGEYLGKKTLEDAVQLLRERYATLAPPERTLAQLEQLATMTAGQRAGFWKEQFERCTRCYACRGACPGCYCQRCVVEKNQPQWISASPRPHGNFSWNIIRAYHQAGRCTLCGACEAACPQGIPLLLLNAHVDRVVTEAFDHRSGYDLEARPLIGSWKATDDDSFMR